MSTARATALLAATMAFYSPNFAAAQQSAPQASAGGESVYTYWCATCHSPGPSMPGTQALQAKYGGNPPAVLTERPDLTPEFIALIVRSGISVMPPFRKTEISDSELAALSDYIVTLARRSAGD